MMDEVPNNDNKPKRESMNAKKTFEEALRLMMSSANCMALSRKLGRNQYFISNAANQMRKGGKLNRRTVQDLYTVFPMLKELVQSGSVEGPALRSMPATNNNPEHMAKMHAARKAKAAERRAQPIQPTLESLAQQLNELRSKLQRIMPSVF